MSDLISRSAAIESLDQHSYENGSDYAKTAELLNDLPAIDAVPVVRCKDCRWYDSAFCTCSKCGVCLNFDFYCADGEKETYLAEKMDV